MQLQRSAAQGARTGTRSNDKLNATARRLSWKCRPRVSRASGREWPAAYRLRVSCTAPEQDTEDPCTSGRGSGHVADVHLPQLFVGSGEEGELEAPLPKISTQIKGCTTIPLLLELLRAQGPTFRPKDTSHAFHRLAKLHAWHEGEGREWRPQLVTPVTPEQQQQEQQQQQRLQEGDGRSASSLEAARLLCDLAARQAEEFDVWGVSITIWSLGALGHHDPAALGALCRRGSAVVREFSPIDCASSLVGLARLRVRERGQREFVDSLLAHTLEELGESTGEWKPQELSNVAWALSQVGVARGQRRALLDTLMDVAQWRLDDFNMQELTTLVYSYAKLHYRTPSAMVRISKKVGRSLDQLRPQDASMLLWGFARLAFEPGGALLERLPFAILDKLDKFKPQEICNLAYGYGCLRYHHPALMDAVARSCAHRLPEFSTQDVVLTLWAFGTLRHVPDGAAAALLPAACGALLQRRRRLLPMQVAIALKSMARLGFQPPPEFMAAMAALALERLPAFKPVELCHVIWALAALGYRDARLVEAIVARAVALLQLGAQPLPKTTVDTIVWAAQRVGYWPQALIDSAEMRGIYVKAAYQGANQQPGQDEEAWERRRQQQLEEERQAWQGPGGGGGGSEEGDPWVAPLAGSLLVSGLAEVNGAATPLLNGSSGGDNGSGGGAGELQVSLGVNGASLTLQQQRQQQQLLQRRLRQQLWGAVPVTNAVAPGVGANGLAPPLPLQPSLQAAWLRRPPPKPLSMHQGRQSAQLALHRDQQQQHQEVAAADADAAAAGAEGSELQQPQQPSGVD